MPTSAASTKARRTDRADRADQNQRPRTRAWRWVAAFVAVTALHWLAAEWIERHRGAPPPVAQVRVPVQVRLLKPERIEREARPASPAPAAAAPRPAPKPRPRPAEAHTLQAISPEKPHPAAPAAPAAPAQAASAPEAASASASASAAAAAAGSGASGTAGAASGNGSTPSAQAAQVSHGLKFSVPPSGELQYDTFYNGVRNQPGTIHWFSDGQRYEMVVAVPLPFVGTFSWTSKGHVDGFGLAPDQYIEKRGRRAADIAIFNRTDKQIVFTRTPNSLALPDGAQDRFSMVMQLASLVRGDPDAYKPGVTREFYVADNNSGETWPITTIGDETVNTDQGSVSARHFMRLPRHDGDKRRIDVWLAPSLGWLPVRLVQTEPNGSQFELVWRGALAVPSAGAPPADEPADAGGGAADGAPGVAPAPSTAAPAPQEVPVQPEATTPSPSPSPSPSTSTTPSPSTSPSTTPASSPASPQNTPPAP
ncbi:DUF3108 domain-containing protein [Paraburkholderia sp. J41]|uniref:DUF3108 domain-containing protein n=1 Tax=Paraburkholderia sp. J41 TaxID=2805433 RepID=UPI002AC32633|nr:DUF3108 domain-containing protein [Paraburkholderia sp. J41]